MTTGVNSREQRLRKQAELQSLTGTLANLREQEESYITAQALIPGRLTEQITKIRQQIGSVEHELIGLDDESIDTPGWRLYQEGLAAEQQNDFTQAIKLYRRAARYAYSDANAAVRSLRYHIRVTSNKSDSAHPAWSAATAPSKSRFSIGVIATLLIFVLVVTLILNSYLSQPVEQIAVLETAVTLALTPTFLPATILVPNTATAISTPTATTQSPTATTAPPAPATTEVEAPPPSVSTATATTPLKAAPAVIGPKNDLVWGDGAIVFEFENLSLPDNELYCLDTLRGYDATLTENWSFPPIGSKTPRIPIEANVFRIAKLQDIQCVVWSAYIGQESCEKMVSELSEARIIGLPRPCNLN